MAVIVPRIVLDGRGMQIVSVSGSGWGSAASGVCAGVIPYDPMDPAIGVLLPMPSCQKCPPYPDVTPCSVPVTMISSSYSVSFGNGFGSVGSSGSVWPPLTISISLKFSSLNMAFSFLLPC